MKFSILFILLFFSIASQATIYIPITLQKQLDDATALVHGTYQGAIFKKNPDGEVVTEISLKLEEFAGIVPTTIRNAEDFRLSYQGGEWEGITYEINGAPNFAVGEEVYLLLVKKEWGYTLSNFGLGKYNVKKIDGEKFLQSAVFPTHQHLGKIDLKELNNSIVSRFGKPLLTLNRPEGSTLDLEQRFTAKLNIEKKESRAPASLKEESEESETPFSMFWLVLCISILGVFSFAMTKDWSEGKKK